MPAAATRLIVNEPPPTPSSSIVVLADQWERLHVEAKAAWAVADRASNAAFEIIPMVHLPEGSEQGWNLHRDQLAQLDLIDRQRGRIDPKSSPRVEAYDLWRKQNDAIFGYFRSHELEKAADDIQKQANDIAEEIRAIRPTDAYSAARKFRVLRFTYEDGDGGFDDAAAIHAFQDDLDFLASTGNPVRSPR